MRHKGICVLFVRLCVRPLYELYRHPVGVSPTRREATLVCFHSRDCRYLSLAPEMNARFRSILGVTSAFTRWRTTVLGQNHTAPPAALICSWYSMSSNRPFG